MQLEFYFTFDLSKGEKILGMENCPDFPFRHNSEHWLKWKKKKIRVNVIYSTDVYWVLPPCQILWGKCDCGFQEWEWGPEKCSNLLKEEINQSVGYSSLLRSFAHTVPSVWPPLPPGLHVADASIMWNSAQLSPPHRGPPWSHYSKSSLPSLCHVTLIFVFLSFLSLFENDLI